MWRCRAPLLRPSPPLQISSREAAASSFNSVLDGKGSLATGRCWRYFGQGTAGWEVEKKGLCSNFRFRGISPGLGETSKVCFDLILKHGRSGLRKLLFSQALNAIKTASPASPHHQCCMGRLKSCP